MHYRIFETWRLVAALSIMMWHFLRFAPPGYEEVGAYLYRLLAMMEMFFMISGFLIMERYGDDLFRGPGRFRAYLVRRLARFYPLYLATLLFFCGVALAVEFGLVHTADPGRYAWSALPANLFLLQAWGLTDQLTFNYVAWCLSAEWFCYLLLPVVVLAYRLAGIAGLAALAGALVLALEVAVARGAIPFESWLQADTFGAYRAFADFTIGALVSVAVRRSRLRLTAHWPAWALFGLSLLAMATRQHAALIVGLLALAMYVAAVAERNDPEGSRYLAFLHPLGKVSLGIYLLHPVIEAVFFSLVWRMLVEPTGLVGFYVYWLAPGAATLALAILSERHFERPLGKAMVARFGRVVSEPAVRAPAVG
ncbi:acyltransferase [Aquibium carbonis]|uniref:Acyltransferase n=1 Tax=Aquibium carbonis TaxID=2495581 RepID=A0A429YT98_9HYPH|nr:acyltransferase [Aquibium carbonis]RST84671.1 acyltransferase [Aquibium carbonis]